MFLITFWEVPGLNTSHYSKNTKISIFIKMDLGLFKILGFFGGGGVRGLKMGE